MDGTPVERVVPVTMLAPLMFVEESPRASVECTEDVVMRIIKNASASNSAEPDARKVRRLMEKIKKHRVNPKSFVTNDSTATVVEDEQQRAGSSSPLNLKSASATDTGPSGSNTPSPQKAQSGEKHNELDQKEEASASAAASSTTVPQLRFEVKDCTAADSERHVAFDASTIFALAGSSSGSNSSDVPPQSLCTFVHDRAFIFDGAMWSVKVMVQNTCIGPVIAGGGVSSNSTWERSPTSNKVYILLASDRIVRGLDPRLYDVKARIISGCVTDDAGPNT